MRMPSTSSSSRSPSPSMQSSKPSGSIKATRKRGDKESIKFNKTSYPLQRGSACLSCRRRKMKCDAGKPACTQCVKANRAGDCDYDDGKSKSRTQLLQEKISTLENRLRDLESPSSRPSPSSLHSYHSDSAHPLYAAAVDPALLNGSPSSFDLTSLSNNGSPTPGSPESLWVGDPNDLHLPSQQGLRVPSDDLHWNVDPFSLPPEEVIKVYGHWWEADMPPPRISQSLLDIFLPHRHQCGFEVNVNRFKASLNSGQPPHPALMNVIYALACHFSMSPILTPYVSHFTSRALGAISSALEASDSLVHILQASCLLAVLFFIKGRLLEGYYHAGAAARMAVGLGLHQLPLFDPSPNEVPATSSDRAPGSAVLGPPGTSGELGERILTFWQVYNLDRCWAVATGLPVALAEDAHPRNRIETAWPRTLEEYELGHFPDSEVPSGNYLTYRSRDSINTLRAKASTLFERAARISLSYVNLPQNADQFWSDFHGIDAAISRLTLSLPPIRVSVDDRRVNVSMFVIHSLFYGATIQLHSPFVSKDATSRQKSIGAATQATNMIQELDDVDYSFLDPIMGTCWTTVAEAIMRELLPVNQGITLDHDYSTLNAQLDLVLMAMNRLGAIIPLVAYQASKVEQSRITY